MARALDLSFLPLPPVLSVYQGGKALGRPTRYSTGVSILLSTFAFLLCMARSYRILDHEEFVNIHWLANLQIWRYT